MISGATMKRVVWCTIMATILAVLSTSSKPAGVANAAETGLADSRRATGARAIVRARLIDQLSQGSHVGTTSFRAAATAAAPETLTILDLADTRDPRADVREVTAGPAGSGSLRLTVKVQQYVDPILDPSWVVGFTSAFWFIDTSGDGSPDVVVEIFNDGLKVVADMFDAQSGTIICDGIPETLSTNRSYSVVIANPGCFGDTVHLGVGGGLVFDPDIDSEPLYDFAPDDGRVRELNRSVAPTGAYTVVSRTAAFERFGVPPPAFAPTSTTSRGIFENYLASGPVVSAASARPFDPALWSVTANGEVSTQDGGEYYGDAMDISLNQPIVGMTVLPGRNGYWLVAKDGGIFSYGDAEFFGSTGGTHLNQPIVGMASTATGAGYWLVAADGGIFAYGDAQFYGSTGSLRLNEPVVGMASGFQDQGYWLVARDGGVFSYGLPFYGSTGSIHLNQPIVGMAATRSGNGYRFIARDGGVFSYGDAQFHGSGAVGGRTDVVGLTSS